MTGWLPSSASACCFLFGLQFFCHTLTLPVYTVCSISTMSILRDSHSPPSQSKPSALKWAYGSDYHLTPTLVFSALIFPHPPLHQELFVLQNGQSFIRSLHERSHFVWQRSETSLKRRWLKQQLTSEKSLKISLWTLWGRGHNTSAITWKP